MPFRCNNNSNSNRQSNSTSSSMLRRLAHSLSPSSVGWRVDGPVFSLVLVTFSSATDFASFLFSLLSLLLAAAALPSHPIDLQLANPIVSVDHAASEWKGGEEGRGKGSERQGEASKGGEKASKGKRPLLRCCTQPSSSAAACDTRQACSGRLERNMDAQPTVHSAA